MYRGLIKIIGCPLSLIYGVVISLRNALYNRNILKSTSFRVPVISVGNLAVGGTGKTPHTEYLVSILKKEFNVAVLSRGYRRKTRGFILADNNCPASQLGDEPAQIKNKFPDIVVAVDEDRKEGIKNILKLYPSTDVILLDDAFQHRRINPGLSIVLTSFESLYSRDHLLPCGRLREHRHNIKRADIILVSRSPEEISGIDRRLIVGEIKPLSHQNLYFTSVIYREIIPVFTEKDESDALPADNDLLRNKHILLVTGIANPRPMVEYLNQFTENISHLKYKDHHPFREKDLENIVNKYHSLPKGKRCLITSEKDAVRLKEICNIADFADNNIFFLPIGTKILNNDEKEFTKHITDYVRKNKANSIVS